MSTIKLFVLTNIPTPYQADFWGTLGKRVDVDVSVYYMASIYSDRHWRVNFGAGYKYHLLHGLGPEKYRLCIGIAMPIIKGEYDIYILSGTYVNPTFLVARLLVGLFRRKWYFWGEPLRVTEGISGRIKQWMRRILLQKSDGILAIGSWAVTSCKSLGIANDKISVIPYSRDTTAFQKHQSSIQKEILRRNLGFHTGVVVFMFCGQLIKRKGVDILLDAFAKLQSRYPDTALLFLGSGPLQKKLEEEIELRRIQNVLFAGHIEPSELPAYFNAADVFVLPSRHDGWGVVVNEAMAAGLPIIASDRVGAAYDLIRNGENGYIVSCCDVDALRDSMMMFAANPKLAERMGGKSAEIIQEWTPERMADRLVNTLTGTGNAA